MPLTGQVVVAGTVDPAAGAELTVFTVPAGQTWELQTVRFTLVTDATVANRHVSLVFDDGTNVMAKLPVRSNQAASLSHGYSFAQNVDTDVVLALEVLTEVPRLVLPAGFRCRTITQNLQAGDNFSAGVYSYIG